MPIINGFEFFEAFAKLKENNDAYISSMLTMFTSSEQEEDKQRATSYDFVKDYVVKGRMSPENLREMVEECLSS